MKKFICALAVGIFVLANTAQADGIKEGKWNMTITTKVAGMEGEMAEAMKEMENMSPEDKAMMQQMMGGMMNMGAGAGGGMTVSTSQCITNDNPVPQNNNEEGCTSTHNLNGNTVNFEVTCPESKSTGEVTYQDTSMSGVINSVENMDGKPTNATIEISGEYAGPCAEY